MATDIARQIGKFAAENSPEGTNISVTELRYKGLLSGSDFMIAVGVDTNRHPLYDAMGDNDYLKALRSGNPVTIYMNNQNTQQQTVINDYSYQRGDGTISFGAYNPTLADNPTHPLTVANTNTRSAKGVSSQLTGKFMGKPISSSTGVKLVPNADRQTTLLLVGLHAKINVIPGSTAWESDIKSVESGYAHGGGLYSYSSLETLQSDLLSKLRGTGIFGYPVVRSLGIHVQLSNFLNSSHGNVPLPFVSGTRRYVAIIPGAGSVSTWIISGYILGEGPDVVFQNYDFVENTPDGVMRIGRISSVTYADQLPPLLSSEIKQHSFVTRKTYYPMSYNTLFLDDLIVNGKTSSVVDGPDDIVNSCNVSYTMVEADVVKIKGSVSKSDLRNYLSTGYGVLTPKSAADVDTIMKSWESIPESVAFVIAPYACSGYSFKNTKLFSEYRRRREKACKENDFMDRPFNSEYTYKQVENRLTSLTSKSVLAMDRSLVGKGRGISVLASPSASTINFSVKDAVTFSYTTSAGATGTVVRSTEGVIALLASLEPPHKITGAVAEIDALMGAGVESYNAELGASIDTSVSMRIEDQMLADIFDYSSLKETQTYDQMVAIMALQITDYANFEAAAPRLIKSLLGDSVYPAMIKQLKPIPHSEL